MNPLEILSGHSTVLHLSTLLCIFKATYLYYKTTIYIVTVKAHVPWDLPL